MRFIALGSCAKRHRSRRSVRAMLGPCTLFAALLAAGSAAYGEQIYKWKDDSGRWHFSDSPSPTQYRQAKPVSVAPIPRSAPAPSKADPGYYSIINQANRISADGEARRQQRATKQQGSQRAFTGQSRRQNGGSGERSGRRGRGGASDYARHNPQPDLYKRYYGPGYRRPGDPEYFKYKNDLPYYHDYPYPAYRGGGRGGRGGRGGGNRPPSHTYGNSFPTRGALSGFGR